MRATEFLTEDDQKGVTINIPITISIPAGGGMPTIAAAAGKDMPNEPVFVPPLQQEIELMKQQGGKKSKVINQIVSDNGAGSDMSEEYAARQEEAKANYFNLSEDFDSLMNIYNENDA